MSSDRNVEWTTAQRRARVEELLGLADGAIAKRLIEEGCPSTSEESLRRLVNGDRRALERKWRELKPESVIELDPAEFKRVIRYHWTIYREAMREFARVEAETVTETQRGDKITKTKRKAERGGIRQRYLETALAALRSISSISGFDVAVRGGVNRGDEDDPRLFLGLVVDLSAVPEELRDELGLPLSDEWLGTGSIDQESDETN